MLRRCVHVKVSINCFTFLQTKSFHVYLVHRLTQRTMILSQTNGRANASIPRKSRYIFSHFFFRFKRILENAGQTYRHFNTCGWTEMQCNVHVWENTGIRTVDSGWDISRLHFTRFKRNLFYLVRQVKTQISLCNCAGWSESVPYCIWVAGKRMHPRPESEFSE